MHTVLHEYWRSVALRGLSALVCAAVALFEPRLTMTAVILVFAGYVVFDGALTARIGYRNRRRRGAKLVFVEGLVRIAAGLALVPLVGLAFPALGYVLAVTALVAGGLELSLAYRMRNFAFAGPYWAFGAAVSLFLGVFLLTYPQLGASLFVLFIGLYALVFGASMLALAHRLRRIERRLRPLETNLAGAPPRHA
jgi:uncharacterized membrane protein HdeD (DUF308 family)